MNPFFYASSIFEVEKNIFKSIKSISMKNDSQYHNRQTITSLLHHLGYNAKNETKP